MDKAIGMLYSLIIRLPDLDEMLRPIILELEKERDVNKPLQVANERHQQKFDTFIYMNGETKECRTDPPLVTG